MMIPLVIFLSFVSMVTPKLLHVHVLFRHGDRSPIGPIYPKDVHQSDAWPIGLGELTKKGAGEAYELGRYLRQRYNSILSNNFNPKEIYVRSTNINRALMTAEACLSGLYLPKSEKDQFNSQIRWNPVPVHTVPESEDYLLLSADCPMINELWKNVTTLPLVRKIDEDNRKLFTLLANGTGVHPYSLLSTGHVYDTMFCERQHNLAQPKFITAAIWEKMTTFSDLGWKLYYHTKELRRLHGGTLLNEVLEDIMAISGAGKSKYPKDRKLKMYSAHDTTVSSYLAAAGVYNDVQPPYASVVMTELREEDGKYFIRILFRNSTEKAHLLVIPGCTESCPIEKLPNLWSATILPANLHKKLCHSTDKSTSNMLTIALSYTFGFISFIGLVCIIVFIIAYIMRRQQRYRRYSRLDAYVDGEAMVNLNSGS